MDKLVRLVEHIPLSVLIPAIITAVSLVVLLIIRSFREGREISFWPPKIGARPELKHVQEPGVPVPRAVPSQPANNQHVPGSALGSLRMSRTQETAIHKIDFDRLEPGEVIGQTEHSLIQKCIYDGKMMVIKRTLEELCDLDALHLLIKAIDDPLGGWSESIRSHIGAPRIASTKDGFLWELQDYYEGMSLGNLILETQQCVAGAFLRFCSRPLFNLLFVLGPMGLVHRDINPFNLFLTYSGRLMLIDWTFCKRLSTPLEPVVTAGYTAPEQKLGRPTHASDWYSFAATLFFLGNGMPPPERGTREYEKGLGNLSTGGHKLRFRVGENEWGEYLSHLCDGLLSLDATSRMIPSTIDWEPASFPGGPFRSLRIFDLGPSNHLVISASEFWILPRDLEDLYSALRSRSDDEVPSTIDDLLRRYGQTPP